MIELSPAERAFIAARLSRRAKDKTKNLAKAVDRGWHPELIRQLREDISECERLANVLQEEAA